MNNLHKWLQRICILLIACTCISAYHDFRRITPNKEKTYLLQQKIHTESVVNLDEEIIGNWDSVLLVGAYTSKKDVKKATHVNVRWLDPYYCGMYEENILIFCKGEKVVDYIRLSRIASAIDWGNHTPYIKKIPRNKAIFQVSQTEDKYLHLPFYLLRPV